MLIAVPCKLFQRLWVMLLCSALVSGCSTLGQSAGSGDIAFVGVSVIAADGASVLKDQTVIVRDGKISHIGDRGQTTLRNAAAKINAAGLFLVPGLADMHVHLDGEDEAWLYLAHGVTTVRNMRGTPDTLALRKRILAGKAVGPSIITSGPLVDGSPPLWPGSAVAATPEDAARIVSGQFEAGYDFVKIYSKLTPEVFNSVISTAAAVGIPVAGHLPDAVPIQIGLEAKMASMEHLLGFDPVTTNDGMGLGERGSPQRLILGHKLAKGLIGSDDIFDEAKLATLAAAIAASETWITPTLLAMKNIYLANDCKRALMESERMKYVSPKDREQWNPSNDFRLRSFTEEEIEAARTLMNFSRNRVRALHAGGARLLIGSDAPNPFVFHGVSTHEEMEEFVAAGIPPYEVFLIATNGAAEFLGQAGQWGVVAEGARADLVLLSGNPAKDISNYRLIQGVMVRGQWLDHHELQSQLQRIAKKYQEVSRK